MRTYNEIHPIGDIDIECSLSHLITGCVISLNYVSDSSYLGSITVKIGTLLNLYSREEPLRFCMDLQNLKTILETPSESF
jgi:hypothetical protein